MATLPADKRREIMAELMSDWSNEREVVAGLTKGELLAAVEALDDFMNANAGTINSTIPQPARTALTAPQKARLLNFVVRKRFIEGV